MTSSNRAILTLAALVLALLAACAPRHQPDFVDQPWQMADLRVLEAPGAPDPNFDLVAGYARQTSVDLELRVDLLGSPEPFSYDLYFAYQGGPQSKTGEEAPFPLDQQPEMGWDLAFELPARGLPRAFRPDGTPVSVRPRINRLNIQDAAVVRLSLNELRQVTGGEVQKATFQVFLTRPGERTVLDSLGPLPVSADEASAPRIQQTRVLLAFWNTLPAATPAQALRRWDGAHTGPYGQRHGLQVLLQAAGRTQTPVTLLDLKQPDSLAALEALGGLANLREMVKDGLVSLPDVAYGDPQADTISLGFSRAAGQRYGFADSPFRYGAASGNPSAQNAGPGARAAFARLAGAPGPVTWGQLRLIPLPDQAAAGDQGQVDGLIQADEEGLILPVRQALLRAALEGRPGRLTVLGGDLPRSPWGDSLIAGPAMEYLAGHPWLHVVNGAELLNLPAQPGAPDCPNLLCAAALPAAAAQNQATLRAALQGAPAGLFTDLAWQAYLRLTGPADDNLRSLRAGQLGEVLGPLLAAGEWNALPAAQTDCTRDLNWDGAPECILANATTFLVLDPRGGRLVYAAARVDGRPVQVIAARAQYALGLGDPLEYRPERGPAGDPQNIPGAFAPPLAPYAAGDWQPYRVETSTAGGSAVVTFTHPAGGLRKIYRLNATGAQISIEVPPGSPPPAETALPLALVDSPPAGAQTQTAQTGDYARYQVTNGSPNGSFTWRLTGGAQVQARAQNAGLESHAFSESRDLLRKLEDPNLSYPPGHFIPFPLAVVTVKPQGSYTVELAIQKNAGQ